MSPCLGGILQIRWSWFCSAHCGGKPLCNLLGCCVPAAAACCERAVPMCFLLLLSYQSPVMKADSLLSRYITLISVAQLSHYVM